MTVINGGCSATFARLDGVIEGQVTLLDDFTMIAALPAFGGGCTVTSLPLGPEPLYLRRWAVSCPRCEFFVVFDGN